MLRVVKPTATLHVTVKKLKSKYSCVGIKTSFEDEGARPSDVIKLRSLTSENGLKLAIKIGGCEAKTDINTAMDLCADSLVSPMVESKYALEKYVQATKSLEVSRGVNLETITALDSIDQLLSVQGIDYFVIGRVDLMGSLGQTRDEIESEDNQYLIEQAFTKIKKTNKLTYMGGAISKKTKPFVERLYSKGLLDYVETRFVIMKLCPELFASWEEAIQTSHEFELKWTQSLASRALTVSNALSSRLTLIKSRVWRSFSIDGKRVCYDPEDMTRDEFTINASPYDYSVKFTNAFPVFGQNDFVIIDKKLGHYLNSHNFAYEIEAKEENKTVTTVMNIVKYLSDRRTPMRIVVVGGGIIQDIGAFLSTIFNRGVEWVYWPTTLLAMADSCIGGKSSLNLDDVKNKVGTFSCPHKVFINSKFLDSLDFAAIRSGHGEILKLCMIGDALDIYEKSDEIDRIKVALLVKRAVIEADQFDKGIRRALNYGHTVGHALESLSGYTIPHGVAVIKGMLVENKLFGYSDLKFERLASTITSIPGIDADVAQIREVLSKDKKVTKNIVQFAVPQGPGNFEFKYIDIGTDVCSRIKGMISE
jgi:3-dehydroquinate synthase